MGGVSEGTYLERKHRFTEVRKTSCMSPVICIRTATSMCVSIAIHYALDLDHETAKAGCVEVFVHKCTLLIPPSCSESDDNLN